MFSMKKVIQTLYIGDTSMDSKNQFCPNIGCSASGKIGQGNIIIHSSKTGRYLCKICGHTFSERRGTAFYRLRTDANHFSDMVSLMKHGCPPQAIVATYNYDERTVYAWYARGAEHSKKVHEAIVAQYRVDAQHVQADELCIRVVRSPRSDGSCTTDSQVVNDADSHEINGVSDGMVQEQRDECVVVPTEEDKGTSRHMWMAMAMDVSSRLWLGGVVAVHRDNELIVALAQKVRDCVKRWDFLLCVDGLISYVYAFTFVFSMLIFTGKPGRPKRETHPGLVIAQVVKDYAKGRVSSVIRRVVRGSSEMVDVVLKKTGSFKINTSYIERLNATFRGRLAALVRKGRAIAHTESLLDHGMYLVGCSYNFCYFHDSLRVAAPAGSTKKWVERTPAMAAGLTDHQWTMKELLGYKVCPRFIT